jgi:poly(ADP-ribose) glycohydrolase ARH3
MLGTFLGDAFGRPIEGTGIEDNRLPGWVERRRRSSDPLGYSDDTEMMIFVAESILECGRVDADYLLHWMATHHEPARGYGKGTRAAFAAAARGVPATEAAFVSWPQGSKGNGAAVRVAPIACVYVHDESSLATAAATSANVTHADPGAVDAAVVMARAIAALLRAPERAAPVATSFIAQLQPTDRELATRLALVPWLVEQRASALAAVAALGNGILAIESVPLALFCFLRWGSDFESAVVQTALCGGDVDSIAAMNGALSGALVGAAGLPAQWLTRAEGGPRGHEYVTQLADRICAVALQGER